MLLVLLSVALVVRQYTQTVSMRAARGRSTHPGLVLDPRFQYNLAMSEWLPVDRPLPDVRPHGCKPEPKLSASLPTTSVIIVEVNDADVTLLRTVRSVVDRSPAALLAQVIIVDDNSEWPVGKSVRDASPLVHVTRNVQRQGLIRSRLVGYRLAHAVTITFLDAHASVLLAGCRRC